jgi:ferredoxin
MQFSTIDVEFAQLFEDYYHKAFNQALTVQPSIHRVIPVNVSIRNDMEVRPFESATEIVSSSKAWGVINCLCRTQKALIGEPCSHPLDVCMILSDTPGVFDNNPNVHAQTLEEALATLQRAAEAGLVHSVSNNRAGIWYICNCCTCSCGVLRGMRDLGIANVIARSAFVNQVDEDLCINCGTCVERCQFNALALDDILRVNNVRCVGCGVCVLACQEGALHLVRRPVGEIVEPPLTEAEWRKERATARSLDLSNVL